MTFLHQQTSYPMLINRIEKKVEFNKFSPYIKMFKLSSRISFGFRVRSE